MPTVTALACPVCGAPLQHGSSRCSYCGSMVTIALDHPLITPESINQALVGKRISVHRAAVRRDAHDEVAHYGLGVAYFNLGLLEESADELAEAARLVPENPNTQFQLAVVLFDLAKQGQQGAEAKSVDRLKRTLLLQPSHEDAHLLMAQIHHRSRRWSEMLDSLEKAAPKAHDRVMASLRELVKERESELERVETQIDQAIEREKASQPTPPKSRRTFWTTLGVSLLLFVIGGQVSGSQSGLGSVFVFAGLAALVVVPVLFALNRKLSRDRDRGEVEMPDRRMATTVPELVREARDLNIAVGQAEKTLRVIGL